jgi:hypothetical protein
MTIQQLEDQKKAVEAERFRLGGDGHSTLHLDNRVHDIENQIEALRSKPQANQQHGPTDKQISAKQRELNAQTEKSLGGITFHHSRREAESALLLERSGHAGFDQERRPVEKAGQSQSRADEIREIAALASGKQGVSSEPKRSLAQWAQGYESKANADRSVSYQREGSERFVDRGNSIGIKSADERSIRDAVALGKEKWGNSILVTTQDQQKRESVMRAMAEQNVRLGNNDPVMQRRFAEITKQVEREKLDTQLARPQRVEESQEHARSQVMLP